MTGQSAAQTRTVSPMRLLYDLFSRPDFAEVVARPGFVPAFRAWLRAELLLEVAQEHSQRQSLGDADD